MRLRHAGDLLGLADTAHLADVEVEDRGGAVLDEAREVELGRQPLAGRSVSRRTNSQLRPPRNGGGQTTGKTSKPVTFTRP
jgi:hypothetical protein